ncbi:probable sugar phosphate/phosphate translocator [Tanacetum coccineum]|uniref:Probable sugar phosphate/phosphate translocator n=1 Tax=Tanacetum coccineum TaxID=301880 RepID=A0ABQ5IDC9_9ASTR
MLKALMPVAVYILGVLFKRDVFKNMIMLNMLSISLGVAIAAYGEAKFSTLGVMLQLGAVLFEATRLVLIQILEESSFRFDYFVFWTNSFCAFALNLAVFLLVGKTSALTMNVAGVVKDWLLIAFSWSVIKNTVTPINLFGYGIAFLGIGYNNYVKLQALKAKEAEKKVAQAGDESGKLLDDKDEKLAKKIESDILEEIEVGLEVDLLMEGGAGGEGRNAVGPAEIVQCPEIVQCLRMAVSWRGVYTNTAMAVIPERPQRGRLILGYVTEIVSSVRTPYLGEAFTLTQPWRLLHLSDHVQLRPREGVKKVDTMIIQAIRLLVDLDKELNTYAMRVREWYGWHFPELAKIVQDNILYAKAVNFMGYRTNTAKLDFSEVSIYTLFFYLTMVLMRTLDLWLESEFVSCDIESYN